MSKIRKILFPTDFSETAQNAFQYCLQMADFYKAEIVLLHVVYPEYEMMDLPVMATKATKDKLEAARSALQSFSGLTVHQVQEGAGLSTLPVVQNEVEVGAPVGVITKIAARDEVDLILLGTKGEHNALERTLGSVTTGVIEHAHCPVLVIPEAAVWKQIQTLAYATDLSESDPYHVWKTIQMLEPFHPVAHVVHVSNGSKEGEVSEKLADMEDFFNRSENNTAALQIAFHELDRESVTVGLEEFVSYYEIDVLAMFAPHHSWIDRLFSSSTTRKMVFETTVPLLLLKDK